MLLVFAYLAAYGGDTDSLPKRRMIGTFYADKFVGRHTSSGEIFDQSKPTAAHFSIKLGTWVRVTNTRNGLQVVVKVNDRCPKDDIIDLSRSAARSIGIRGTAPVTVEILPSEEYAMQLIDEQQSAELREIHPTSSEPQDDPPSIVPKSTPSKTTVKKAPVPKATTKAPSKKSATAAAPQNQKKGEKAPVCPPPTDYGIKKGYAATVQEAYDQTKRIPFF